MIFNENLQTFTVSRKWKKAYLFQPDKHRDCRLLKLRWMGTQSVQMKGVLPWLVCWARRAGTWDFFSPLEALVSPVQNSFFPHRTLFQFMCPHRPTTWVGSRAGPPICECVSPLTSKGRDAAVLETQTFPVVFSIPWSFFHTPALPQGIEKRLILRWFQNSRVNYKKVT